MIPTRDWRAWVPGVAFIVLAGSWYVANLVAYRASLQTLHDADTRIVAAGHEPVFTNWPSVWALQQNLRPALFGIIGAAVIAVLLRRVSRWPWFLLAAALPVVMGHAEHLHGWWAPGEGIDQWTFGVPVGIPGLDLSSLGAGPSWTLAGGTVLAVAAAIVPALFVRPAARPVLQRAQLFRALPYVILLAVGAALVTGELRIDNTGDGSSGEMLLAGVGAGLIATLAAVVVPQRQFWRHATPAAIAAGLVTVSGLNPGAMASTKWAAFGAAAGVAVVAALTARRSRLAPRAPHASQSATQPPVHL